MLRYRRYRVFVVFAVLAVFAFFRFTSTRRWEKGAAETVKQQLGHFGLKPTQPADAAQEAAHNTQELLFTLPVAEAPLTRVAPPPIASLSPPVQKIPPELSSSIPDAKGSRPGGQKVSHEAEDLLPGSSPRPGVDTQFEVSSLSLPTSTGTSVVYWVKPTEHFPLPLDNLAQLPIGSKKLPKIQAEFKRESAAQKAKREEQLGAVKEALRHAWNGYREHAWGHDELHPVDGGFRNPFNGWGATLVDTLDTLWIAGMTKEFEEAVEAVGKIDFKTSPRNDIPLFETTIRYLGGLLAAFDVSEGKYTVLLDKAVELGGILFGAFDTPNRMPITYYHWKPAFSSQPHRAGTRTVLAEVGSLSMEFTRLAQLTKEPKYYDA
ncbi:hypothetical protein LTS18_013041, partial [Coniosporium uncinatum]